MADTAYFGGITITKWIGSTWMLNVSISGGVPITGTSHPPGQTDRLKSCPPKPEGVPGLPRWTTKATPAAIRVLMLVFFILRQKIL
jgi:hypothetical protein